MLPGKILKLQQVLMDHCLQLTSQWVQNLSPEDQYSTQASQKWEKRMGYLLSQAVNLIWSGATKKLKFKEPLPLLDSRCDIKTGQQAPSSWQPVQPGSRLGGFEAAFVSHVLSKRGTGTYGLYRANVQSVRPIRETNSTLVPARTSFALTR